MAQPSDSWARKLPRPVNLGLGSPAVETLRDARNFMINLPELRQHNAHWEFAAEALLKAQRPHSTAMDVASFAAIFDRALIAEGLLKWDPKTGELIPARES